MINILRGITGEPHAKLHIIASNPLTDGNCCPNCVIACPVPDVK